MTDLTGGAGAPPGYVPAPEAVVPAEVPAPPAVATEPAAPAQVPSARGEVTPAAAIDALAAEADAAEGKPVEEDTRPTVTVRDKVFHVEVDVPGFVLMKLSAVSDPRTPQPRQMSAIVDFLETVIVDEETDEFQALLVMARPAIGFEELNQIMVDASVAIGARPTQP